MNIFEALEAGDGRATLREVKRELYVEIYHNYSGSIILRWKEHNKPDFRVVPLDLRRNDWIPYVPPEKSNKCPNCENAYFQKIVDVNQQGRCYYCNKFTTYSRIVSIRKC